MRAGIPGALFVILLGCGAAPAPPQAPPAELVPAKSAPSPGDSTAGRGDSAPIASSAEAARTSEPPPANADARPPPSKSSVPEGPRAPIGGLSRGTGDALDRALLEGDTAYFDDELPRAKAAYLRAQRLAPKDPAPPVGLVRVELAASNVATDYAAAPNHPKMLELLRRLERLRRQHPEFGAIEIERGRVLLILGRAEPALAALGRAVELAPADPEAQSALGVALLATGSPNEALPRFRRAAELDPGSADRYRNLGTAELLVGQVEQAVAAYRSAVSIAPADARAHSDLGTAYLAQNAADKALPELRRAVELDPSRATFRSNLAYAALLLGQLDSAEQEAREALRLDAKLGSAWINLGTVQARRGRFDDAEQSFKRALQLDPSDPRAQANLQELTELRSKAPK
jgi:Flp pilus assembly protein TadD